MICVVLNAAGAAAGVGNSTACKPRNAAQLSSCCSAVLLLLARLAAEESGLIQSDILPTICVYRQAIQVK